MAKDVSISFGGELSELKNSLEGMQSYIKGWGSTIAGIGVAAFTFMGAKEALSLGMDFANEAREAASVQAKLEAVVKSTGGAAGFTADQMAGLALEMRKVTGVDDDVIKGAETILSTFKEIRGDEFKRTTQAAIDMAAVLGGDASGAAMQLGKALNDPEKGMMMLAKSGVSFTESQKEMIKTMTATGDVAGAQGIILAEMEAQFGGAAAAAAKAQGPWAEFGMIIGDVREAIGNGLLAVVESLLPMLSEGAELVSGWAESFTAMLPDVTAFVEDGLELVSGGFEILRDTATVVMGVIGELWATAFGESAAGPVDSIFGFVKDVFMGMLELAVGWATAVQVEWENLPTVASVAWDSIKLGAIGMFEDLKHLFTETAPELIRWFGDNWREIFTDIYNFTTSVFSNMLDNITEFFSAVASYLSGDGFNFEWTGLTDGFESTLKELPKIVERELTATEKELQGRIGEQGAMLAGEFQKKYRENMEKLGFGDGVATPEMAAPAAAATAAAVGGGKGGPARAERSSSDKDKEFKAGFEDLGGLFKRIASSSASAKSPEAKAAEKTADASEQTAAETKKVAESADKTVKELREIKTALKTGGRTAVLGK